MSAEARGPKPEHFTRSKPTPQAPGFVAVGYSARHDAIESTRRMTHADLLKLAHAISGK